MAQEVSSYRSLLTPHPQGVVMAILVVPGASRTEIVGVHGDSLRVRVAAPPDDGRANQAMVALVEDAMECRVEFLTGLRSRRKRVLLLDVTPAQATAKINLLSC